MLYSGREFLSAVFLLAAATVAVFISGTNDGEAITVVAVGAAIALLVGRPQYWPGWVPISLVLFFVFSAASSLLPGLAIGMPDWRGEAPEMVPLAASLAAMPGHVWFWWMVLVGTAMGGLFLLASPLAARELRVFLHAVAGVVAVYAVLSMAAAHSAWSWPFAGGANFGFLPNRNHTATLLVVGSIISFGLMQWEVARGYRAAAVVSALCGAPSLAALLFFSTSRAGVIFLALGFALWALGAAGTAVKRRTALGAAAGLAAFLLLLFVLGGSTVRDRLGVLWEETLAAGEGEAGDVDFRQPVFRDTLRMIADAPLTGQGLGHFEFVFPHYREESIRAARVLHPESDWLMVAAETGWPAVVFLALLAGWYLVRCWQCRRGDDGLLRWTVASAIGAALAHGLIDVPWHRPALGWFLLVVALASAPGMGRPLTWPRAWRAAQVLAGLVLLGAGVYLGWATRTERPPLAYRWEAYDREMRQLSEERRFDEGEFVALEAIKDFPLTYQAYYWWAAFLRMFEGTEGEMDQARAAGRFVEPVLPRVASEQAQLWVDLDPRREAEARREAIRRAAVVQGAWGAGPGPAGELENAMRAARERPDVQVALAEQLADEPHLLAHWLRQADADLADAHLRQLGSGVGLWLDSLPEDLRERVLQRWIALPSGAGAVAYMESRGGGRVYARTLANYYARAGERERAVRLVAGEVGISLERLPADGEFVKQLDELQRQGNEVAVRRLVREAVEAKEPDGERLSVAMVWYALAGDWDLAWRAASRLASAPQIRQ